MEELVHQVVQSTKDLPIREVQREAYRKRKEKYGTHHVKQEDREQHEEEEGVEEGHVGQDIVEQVLKEKLEE